MRFSVRHQTWYRYDVPVRLAGHVVRLTPRPGQGELRAHRIRVAPEPVARHEVEDPQGNQVLQVEFAGHCHELHVDSEFELETRPPPALPAALPSLPWSDEPGADVDPTVRSFAATLLGEAGGDAIRFLDRLNQTLYSGFDRHIRPSGDARPAAETLATRRGACRDLALLFMDAARSHGMRTRFVSGYQAQAESVDGQRHLHAWPEVSLPELGYSGWDPTHGLRVGEGHVALCAAPDQAATMPVEGGFYFDGERVTSTLDFSLSIATR